MKPADFDAFVSQLTREDITIIKVVDRGDGTYAAVKRLLFHWTMIVGTIGDFDSYEDRWCYATKEIALDALDEWEGRNFDSEPTGWHRHPASGRRRVGGDPVTEYVNP